MPTTKDIIRPSSRQRVGPTEWVDTSYLPLPDEAKDTRLEDIDDLITNTRDAFIAAQEDFEQTQEMPMQANDDEPLPSP